MAEGMNTSGAELHDRPGVDPQTVTMIWTVDRMSWPVVADPIEVRRMVVDGRFHDWEFVRFESTDGRPIDIDPNKVVAIHERNG